MEHRQTPRIILTGDEEEASHRVREGIKQLGILKGLMGFQKLKQDVRKVRYTDGSEITCRSVFGVEEIEIFAPSAIVERRGEDIFLAGARYSGGVDGRVFRSLDLGTTWQKMDDLDPEHEGYVELISVNYTKDNVCLAGTCYEGMFFRSVNGGQTWVYKDTPVDEMCLYPFYIVDDICLTGTRPNGYILRSIDLGNTWVNVKTSGGVIVPSICYVEDGICLAGTFVYPFAYILRSTDYGLTWTDPTIPGRLESQNISSLLYLEDGVCLAGAGVFSGGYNRIWRSTDFGASWISISSGTDAIYAGIYLGDGICLFGGGTGDGRIDRSTDYGQTWSTVYTSAGRIVRTLACIENVCLAGASDGRIFKSIDQGKTWKDQGVLEDVSGMWSLAAIPRSYHG